MTSSAFLTTTLVIEEIAASQTQAQVALVYYRWLRHPEVDWPRVNEIIIRRWSLAGLRRVKEMAWKEADRA